MHHARGYALMWVLSGLTLATLTACSSVQVHYPDGTTVYKSKEEFERYVEEVFRFHNSVVNDLIIAISLVEDGEIKVVDDWERAEEVMTDACRPLIEAVTAKMEKHEIGFFHKLKLLSAVSACEVESRKFKAMLPATSG